jgi:cyanobactin maturation PatA/PatG family protease
MSMSTETPLPDTGTMPSLGTVPVVHPVHAVKNAKPCEGGTASNLPDSMVQASESCECVVCRAARATQPDSLVFALGTIGYDLVSEARRDSVQQHMEAKASPTDPTAMLEYLRQYPSEAASILWTLSVDQTPLYIILPNGPFAGEVYSRLREFLTEQLSEDIERVSIPGRLVGQARLFNGQMLPVITPELRGMYSWTTEALVEGTAGSPAEGSTTAAQRTTNAAKRAMVRGFLERIYHELRNLGVSSQDRAINYVATNPFHTQSVYEAAIAESMELDTIEVARSQICRPDSDCWDVKVYFFYPDRQVQSVRKVHRFTVDVSDVVPVMIGPVRSWYVR